MMRRRALLAASQTGGDEVRVIKFYVYDYFAGETTEYDAMSNMTWEQWIDSDYNPYLPNGSKKRFDKTSDSTGTYSGYVWYHFWDNEYNAIDWSVEITDITFRIVNLGDKIIENNTYNAM